MENMMCSAHKTSNEKSRDHWDAIFRKKHKNIGESLDSFLDEEGIIIKINKKRKQQ
jgi:hypothetical protein